MPFEDEWLLRQGELDSGFGEDFFLEPMAQPVSSEGSGLQDVNGRAVTSSTRPLLAFVGIFVNAGTPLHAHGRSMADSTTRPVVSERPMVDVPLGALTVVPLQGDRVHRRRTGEVFDVTRYLLDGPVRAWVHLAEKRQPASPVR